MLKFTSYAKNPKAQLKGYLNTLHKTVDTYARFVMAFGNGCSVRKAGTKQYIKKHYLEWLNDGDNRYGNVFITLNEFNVFAKSKGMDKKEALSNELSIKNLYSIDTLMFDIDAKGENLQGYEGYFLHILLECMTEEKFPLPNAVSYTGSGGIHLYYSIYKVTPALANGIKGLKWLMAARLKKMTDDIQNSYGMDYVVDTSVFNETRFDRLPGSTNPKTGIMCEFFSTNVDTYTFQTLLGFEQINGIRWDTFEKKCREAYFENRVYKNTPKSFMSERKKKRRNKNSKTNSFKNTAAKRVNGMLKLGESGYGFYRHRERTCFCFRQMCRQAGFDSDTELDLLNRLNSYFYEPLDEHSLYVQTDSRKSDYKITNETLAMEMGIEIDSEEYRLVFGETKPLKEYGLSPKQMEVAKRYISISKIKLDKPEISINEIQDLTGLSKDMVKKINTRLNKNPENLKHWAETDYTNPDDTEFILSYLKENPLYGKRNSKEHHSIKSDKSPSDDDCSVQKLKQYSLPQADYLRYGESVIKQYKEILRLRKRKDRNLKHINGEDFYGELAFFANNYISKFGYNSVRLTDVLKNLIGGNETEYYRINKMVNGYIPYSEAYLESLFEKYSEIDSIPKPLTNPMYAIPDFVDFEKYIPFNPFQYRPDVILKYNYGREKDNNHQVIPEIYCNAYYEYHNKLQSYRMHKELYEKNRKNHNLGGCRRARQYALELVKGLKAIVEEFEKALAVLQENNKYGSFKPQDINRNIVRVLMQYAA